MTTLITLGLPVLGAVACFLMPRNPKAVRWVATAFGILTLASALSLLAGGGTSLVAPWIPAFGIEFHLGVDGLSVFLVILTAFLTTVVFFFGGEKERPGAYYGLILLLEAATLGAFVSLDLFLFYLFWEFMIIPAYLLIGGFGGERRRLAALKFLVYSLVPSLFMLVGLLVLVWAAEPAIGHVTFELGTLTAHPLTLPYQYWILLSFLFAFLVKVPVWPLHSWLPDAYGEARPPIAALLSGVMSKTGLYALLRIALPLFPQAAHALSPYLAVIALISILYGAMVALTNKDGRLIIGYSSLSHLGLVFLGIVAMNAVGMDGAVFQMVNHGLYVVALFLLFGLIEEATGIRDISRLGGLARRAPLFAGFMLFAVMAALGLPGLNGFAGEFMLLVGIFKTNPVWAWIAILGAILAAAYFIRMFESSMQGPKATEETAQVAIGPGQIAVLAPVLALMLLFGLSPSTLVREIHPATTAIVHILGPMNAPHEVSGR